MDKKQVVRVKIMELFFSSTENILPEEHKVFMQAHPFIVTYHINKIHSLKHVKIKLIQIKKK